MAKKTTPTTFTIRTEKSFDGGSSAESSFTTTDRNKAIEEVKKQNEVIVQQLTAEIGLNHVNLSILIQ